MNCQLIIEEQAFLPQQELVYKVNTKLDEQERRLFTLKESEIVEKSPIKRR